MWKKILNIPKGAAIGVVLFVLLFIAYNALSASQAAELEVGATYTGEFNKGAALAFSERLGGRWDVGLGLVSAQTWDDGVDTAENNGHVWGAFVIERPERWYPIFPSELSLGINYWFKENPPINGCQEGYMLGLKYRFKDFSIGWRHMSNAGTCRPNRGQDLLMFGWRF